MGVSIAVVGLFFSVQEGAALLLKPFGGRVGDRIGYLYAIAAGMAVTGLPLLVLPAARGDFGLLALAVLMGCGQALVFPATVALISTQIDERHVGAGMGLAGTLENAGKVVGPVAGGLLIASLDYAPMFRSMGGLLAAAGLAVWIAGLRSQERRAAVRS